MLPAVKVEYLLNVRRTFAKLTIIIKFQTEMEYRIVRGNDDEKLDLRKIDEAWTLHFNHRLIRSETFHIVITAEPIPSQADENWDKPLKLALHIIVSG